MSLRRFFVPLFTPSLMLSFALAVPVGTDANFAALTVRPNGPEELDLATGVTTLPGGGEIIYRAEDVTLTGSFIRFLEGDFIEAREAGVTGAFGILKAPELRFEVAAQTLRAAQGVTYSGEALELMADTITLNVETELAVLEGGVSSRTPNLTGDRVLIDLAAQQAVLVGPYIFQDGPVTLRGEADKLLALSWDAAGALSAETEVPSALRARFAKQLP